MPAETYVGSELAVFAGATCWKRYWASQLRPFLGRAVLEVGAGIGGSTAFLCDGQQQWVCLEPDPALVDQIVKKITLGELPSACQARHGTLEELNPDELFDTLLYLDVLEHIREDRAELSRAAARLRLGGHLIVLAPAHQSLFSPFDAAIGHYRRYDYDSLTRLSPDSCQVVRWRYLDSVGVLASLANRWLLRHSNPSARQIQFWDKVLVRCSRWLDPCTSYRLGKSILVVWQKTGHRGS
jgi:SAM-dependent methyltransferase